MDGAVYGGAGPSGAGDTVYHLGAFSGGGLHSGDVGAGTAAELSVDEKGQRAYRNERLRLRLCLADAEREDAGERL